MEFILIKLAIVVVITLLSLGIAMYTTLAERKIAGWLQDRPGPERAGPFGILQPLADGVKLFTKEEFIPANAHKFLFVLGPALAMLTATMTSAVIPWGPPVVRPDGTAIPLQVADINIGILYVFAVVSLGVYGIMIGGWASNNKYSLLGAIRASSQMISYELGMGLSIIAVLMLTGSMSMSALVERQHGMNWNILYQPLGFVIFLICAFAETNRAPFDLPECETELIGGYHTEYSSMKLGFYLFAEYINMFISSAIIAALYFGGYNFPGMDLLAGSPILLSILGVVVFFIKIFFFMFVFIWVRWTLPRFRYDQLMRLGWQTLIPLAILNILLTAAGILIFEKVS